MLLDQLRVKVQHQPSKISDKSHNLSLALLPSALDFTIGKATLYAFADLDHSLGKSHQLGIKMQGRLKHLTCSLEAHYIATPHTQRWGTGILPAYSCVVPLAYKVFRKSGWRRPTHVPESLNFFNAEQFYPCLSWYCLMHSLWSTSPVLLVAQYLAPMRCALWCCTDKDDL